MRYVLAIAALVLSGVLLVLGIGQRTFLAGPAEITHRIDITDDVPYAVIPAEAVGQVTGQPNVVVDGEQAFIATGTAIDVEAWAAPYGYSELSFDAQTSELVDRLVPAAPPEGAEEADGEPAEGEASDAEEPEQALPDPVDPRGSDLWLEERSAAAAGEGEDQGDGGPLRMPVALADDEVVLVAKDGEAVVSDSITISWVQDRSTPLAGPFLVGGGVLALVGAVLYLLAVDHDRRGLGPRRGRRGPLLGIRNVFGGNRRAKRRSAGAPEARETEEVKETSDDSTAANGSDGKRERRALRRGAVLPALGLTAALALSGCSASYWPDLAPEPAEEEQPSDENPSSNTAPVPVTETQLDRIVERVAEVAAAADDELDAELLESRFTGDALLQRTQNYKIRDAVPDYSTVPPRITDQSLDYELVQSTQDWPRTLFVTVASETVDDGSEGAEADGGTTDEAEGAEGSEEAVQEEEPSSPSLALILTQESPHENYLVSRVISLRGGISMPQAAPADEGTALLADDLQTLVLPPAEVGTAFAEVLQSGLGTETAELFELEGDPLVEKSGAAWATQVQAASEEEGRTVQYSVTVEQGDEPITSMSTGTGGALVATTVIEAQVADVAGGRWRPQSDGAVTALSGLEGQQDRITRDVAHQMLFYVPSKNSGEPIQVLGATTQMVGARN